LDDSVTKKSWIYPYILTRDEKYLSIRAFTEAEKHSTYEKQQWICPKCWKHFQIEEMEADHITPRSQWGQTVLENSQMLCKEDNRRKSNK
jgi:5-methylcytosine-specific restriction endonuclease McrA